MLSPTIGFRRKYILMLTFYPMTSKTLRSVEGVVYTQCNPSRTRTPNEPNLFSLDALCIGFGFGSERGGRTHVHVIGNRVKKGSWQNIWTDININGHDAVLLYTHYILLLLTRYLIAFFSLLSHRIKHMIII